MSTDAPNPETQATGPRPSTPTRSPIPAGLPPLYPQPGIDADQDAPAIIATRWSWYAASSTGRSHLNTDLENQDAWQASLLSGGVNQDLLVMVVCDGAGSAAYAQEAAMICTRTFSELISSAAQQGFTPQTLDPALLLTLIQDALKNAAEDRPLREYACTFTAAVLGLEHSLLMQVGDGFIVTGSGVQDLTLAFPPQSGEYVNQTTFVHGARPQDLQFSVIPTPAYTLLSSDGLYRLAVDLKTASPHPGFYPPFLAAATQPGFDPDTCQRLEHYLASDAVGSRTDDDVTLILARRLPVK